MLRFLGRIAKGAATLVGIGGVAGTTVALEVPDQMPDLLAQVLEVVRAIFALLALFGIGRKAGFAGAAEISSGSGPRP